MIDPVNPPHYKSAAGIEVIDVIEAYSLDFSLGNCVKYVLRAGRKHAESVYQSGLRRGVPKELARLPVPVGRYSRMRASANLLNWLKFLGLRLPANAQWEIRQFAEAIRADLAVRFPRTLELFREGLDGA